MMPSTNRYLETEVLTAPPQRLRLMLIERAIRSVQATLDAWQESRWADGLEANIHSRDVVAELLSGVDAAASPVAREVASIYAFLFTALTDAGAQRDQPQLRDVLRILEVERETWRQVCEQGIAGETNATSAAVFTPQPAIVPPAMAAASGFGASGFSVEA